MIQENSFMRHFWIILFISLSAGGYTQILPGMSHDQIHLYMNDFYGDYLLTEPSNSDELDFIKYEHISGDKTFLVFLSENDTCVFTRLITDIFYLDDITMRFNNKYEPDGDQNWIARERGEKFRIRLDKTDWIFTVTVRKLNQH